jgi:hypothetical protein
MTAQDEYAEMACESLAAAGEYDHRWDDICRSCGYDDPCGCPMDVNTMTKMSCPSCEGQWWRGWGDTSTRCLHRACGAEGSAVIQEPRYAPHGAGDE